MLCRKNYSGTVFIALLMLIIVVAAIISLARYFWLDSANDHFDSFLAAYIAENPDLTLEDLPALRTRLIENSIFIKLHRWNRDSFIKNHDLYKQMKVTIDQAQMKRDREKKSTMEIMINL